MLEIITSLSMIKHIRLAAGLTLSIGTASNQIQGPWRCIWAWTLGFWRPVRKTHRPTNAVWRMLWWSQMLPKLAQFAMCSLAWVSGSSYFSDWLRQALPALLGLRILCFLPLQHQHSNRLKPSNGGNSTRHTVSTWRKRLHCIGCIKVQLSCPVSEFVLPSSPAGAGRLRLGLPISFYASYANRNL